MSSGEKRFKQMVEYYRKKPLQHLEDKIRNLEMNNRTEEASALREVLRVLKTEQSGQQSGQPSGQSSRQSSGQPSGRVSPRESIPRFKPLPSQSMATFITRGDKPKPPSVQQTYPGFQQMSDRSKQLLLERQRLEQQMRNLSLPVDPSINQEVDDIIGQLYRYRDQVNEMLEINRQRDRSQRPFNMFSRDNVNASRTQTADTLSKSFRMIGSINEYDRRKDKSREYAAGKKRGQQRQDAIRKEFIAREMQNRPNMSESTAQRNAYFFERSTPSGVANLLPQRQTPLVFHEDWFGDRKISSCAPLGRERKRVRDSPFRRTQSLSELTPVRVSPVRRSTSFTYGDASASTRNQLRRMARSKSKGEKDYPKQLIPEDMSAPQIHPLDDPSIDISLRTPANEWTHEIYRRYRHRITPSTRLPQHETDQRVIKRMIAETPGIQEYPRSQRIRGRQKGRIPFSKDPIALRTDMTEKHEEDDQISLD